MRFLPALLLLFDTAAGQEGACPMTMWVFKNWQTCTSRQLGPLTPDATGVIYADNTCRTVDPSSDEDLFPGTYVAGCTSDGQVNFFSSGCTSEECTDSNGDGSCDLNASTVSAFYSRLNPPTYNVLDPSTQGGFIPCKILAGTGSSLNLTVAFAIFGDCSIPECQPVTSPNATSSPTAAPVVPTLPTVALTNPPTEAPVAPTLRPTVALTNPPTQAPVAPTLRPTVALTNPPTEAPVAPTLRPTVALTNPPTEAPVAPTLRPTVALTNPPTQAPVAPTPGPTVESTPSPTTTAPTCLWPGVSCTTDVVSVNLIGQNLGGTIPTEIGLMTDLTNLYLFDDEIVGTIPTEIASLTRLLEWYFGNNRLTGSIPTQFGLLTTLTGLGLRYNQMTGTIPTVLGLLTRLTGLYLMGNFFTGTIPTELNLLTDLQELWLYDDYQLTGTYTCPDFIRSCLISCNDPNNPACRSL